MRIENAAYVVEIEDKHGLIVQVVDKKRRLKLIAEKRLVENFRLLLPLKDLDANYISGSEQLLSQAETTADGVVLRWDGPLTNSRGSYDLAVAMRIDLVGQEIRFRLEVPNGTGHKLSEA